MAVVMVAGRKGGAGKSTIAGNLAGEFASMGRTVAALDADSRHSLAAWRAQRDRVLARCVSKLTSHGAQLPPKVREAEESADVLLPCGPSALDLFPLKDALGIALKARAERRSKKPCIRFVPSRALRNTNRVRELTSSLENMAKKVLPGIGQRVAVADAVMSGLTVRKYAPCAATQTEFGRLAKATDKIVRR